MPKQLPSCAKQSPWIRKVLSLLLGNVLLNSNRPLEELPRLDRALALDSNNALTYLLRGLTLEQLGWHEKATSSYQRAISLAPRNAEAHARLGVVLMVQERRAEAVTSFHKAAQFAPKTSLGRLSEVYGLMAEGLTEKAMVALRRRVALEPGNAPAYAELGKLLAEEGNADEASSAFKTHLSLTPARQVISMILFAFINKGRLNAPCLNKCSKSLLRNELPDIDSIMLELAIGKVFDDLGDPK